RSCACCQASIGVGETPPFITAWPVNLTSVPLPTKAAPLTTALPFSLKSERRPVKTSPFISGFPERDMWLSLAVTRLTFEDRHIASAEDDAVTDFSDDSE